MGFRDLAWTLNNGCDNRFGDDGQNLAELKGGDAGHGDPTERVGFR